MARSISPSENQLKARLLNELRRSRRISSSTILANELPLGTTGVRADLALYAKYFTGVEIKSDRDSLKRLRHQLPVYRRHFDRTILVIGSKHLCDLADIEPDLEGVEVWVASGLSLKRIQVGNVSDQGINQVRLLPPSLQRKHRESDPEFAEARTTFREAFCNRFRTTSANFWSSTRDCPITISHLRLLSRFVEKREQFSLQAAQAKKARDLWLQELTQSLHSSSVSKKEVSS